MRFSHTALRVGLGEDLLPLSAMLHKYGVAHRIYEEQGDQVLKVAEASQVHQVEKLYRAWRNGGLKIEVEPAPRATRERRGKVWQSVPVTLLLILASVAGFLMVYLGAPMEWVAALTFTPFTIQAGQLSFVPGEGQYWRLITPAFLHFGWLHIVFNCLWLWELGSRVERVMGPLNLFGLFLVIAMVSNAAQYLYGGPALFGGMSGVVYGLLGFAWIAASLQPRWAFRPSPQIMLFMVGWLVVCMVGVVEGLGFGRVANAAHLGGLLCGGLLGALFGLASRYNSATV